MNADIIRYNLGIQIISIIVISPYGTFVDILCYLDAVFSMFNIEASGL